MKSFAIAIALVLACVTAHAETITLGSESCTATKICYNTPNDAGVSVDYISDATQYGRLLVSLNGDLYDSGLWAYPTLVNSPLYDAVGNVLYVTLDLSIVHKPCVRSGRVTVCPTIVTLLGGTLTR